MTLYNVYKNIISYLRITIVFLIACISIVIVELLFATYYLIVQHPLHRYKNAFMLSIAHALYYYCNHFDPSYKQNRLKFNKHSTLFCWVTLFISLLKCSIFIFISSDSQQRWKFYPIWPKCCAHTGQSIVNVAFSLPFIRAVDFY